MEWTSSRIEEICDQVDALRGAPRTIEPLPGGLTNHNVKVTTPDGCFVARLDQSDAALLGIERDQEAANTRAAEQSGVGAPYVDYRPDLGVLVVGFIESTTLSNESFQADGEVVGRVARACRQLHCGPRFEGDFDMFRRQAGYLELVRGRGFAHPATYTDHLDDFDRIRRSLAHHPEPTLPCNNDTLAENFLDDGERIWIIDYEYSGNNEPSFELGNIATECDLSLEQTEELTRAYYADDASVDLAAKIARVRLQSTVSRYGWALWGYIQAATSPLDFDFRAWGDDRYEKARADFADPGFDRLLEEASRA
ncbi:choline/ethanolamine kinase family protein [Nocardioides coralli]|uniref:choline/ethanolamine kinase family protein n=1 Tax=Nocardioides coralli TaxID=2872154 RepID=UPI001CA44C32|nr:choline/ethanolamine kinase family protein [Nocardioides coralli]QZY29776.1 phosphotransferase family protein [Nocardioides coralli]